MPILLWTGEGRRQRILSFQDTVFYEDGSPRKMVQASGVVKSEGEETVKGAVSAKSYGGHVRQELLLEQKA